MSHKNSVSKFVAVIAVIAAFGALLGWGWIALGWTQLTTTNDARLAIETAKRPLSIAQYSLPVGSEQTYAIYVRFQGVCASGLSYATCPVVLPPVANSSTTIEDYVTFDLSTPNGTAVRIWYTGPEGNLTFDCGSGMYSSCHIEPNAPGASTGPLRFYFLVPAPGNYTVHVLSEQCNSLPPPYTSNCTTNAATGSVTTGVSTIQYNRPYWAWGLATEIGAIIGIITTIIVAGMTAYRGQRSKGAVHPSRARAPGQGID